MLQNSMKSWDLMEGFGRYQRAAARTMPKLPKRDMLNMLALGLAGESGEVVDAIKKHLYHGHELPKSKVVDELGDVAWYLVNLCTLFDIELSQVIEFNIAKLLDRYPDGFEAERSINRVELKEDGGQIGGVRLDRYPCAPTQPLADEHNVEPGIIHWGVSTMDIYKPGSQVFLRGTAIEATINCASIYAHGGVIYEVVWWADGEKKSAWVSDFEVSTSQPKHTIGFLKGDK